MTPTIIITGLVCLFAGVALGALLTRTLSNGEQRSQELEERLAEVEESHKNYQHEVTQHFVKTSELVSNLTQSYRDVHEHLAASAMHLTNPEISRKLLEAGSDGGRKITLSSLPDSDAEAPRDYAPTVPGGVLSEDYGFKKKRSAPPPAAQGADPVTGDGDNDRDPTLKVG